MAKGGEAIILLEIVETISHKVRDIEEGSIMI